jgi:hypothetical protein
LRALELPAVLVAGVAIAGTLVKMKATPDLTPPICGGGGGGGGGCVPVDGSCRTTLASCGWSGANICSSNSNNAVTCSAPANGTSPTCAITGTRVTSDQCVPHCGFTCNANYHSCGAGIGMSCVSDSSTACGAFCANCTTAVAHGSESCVSGACATLVCDAGYHSCGSGNSSACVLDSNTECGASCLNCTSALANGVESCSTGSCGGAVCNSGYYLASGTCTSQSFTTSY